MIGGLLLHHDSRELPMNPVCPLAVILATLVSAAPAQNVGVQLTHGTDGYVDVPYALELVPRTITVEAWVTYDDTTLQAGNAWPTILRQNNAPGQESYFLRVQAGAASNTVLNWTVQGTQGRASVNWTFQSGQLLAWTHVAATYDGMTARLYINGTEVGNNQGGGRITNRRGMLRIGNGDLSAPGAEEWNGEIDEVRLWPFARTPGEIQATMNQQISTVPGRVATWNLNADFMDSSGQLHGTPVGSIPFVANTLPLRIFPVSGATAFGASTVGCRGTIPMSIAALPVIGNPDFALMCTRVTSSAVGGLLTTFNRLQNPLQLLGIDVWVDLNAAGFLVSAAADSRGVARIGLPVPQNPGLVGARLFGQFVWVDTCGPMGLTASDALEVVLLQ
jgi:hypothetical protein